MTQELEHFQKLLASWHADAFPENIGVNDFGWCCLFSEAMQNVGLTAFPTQVNAHFLFPHRQTSEQVAIDCMSLGEENILADMEGNVGAAAIAAHAASARAARLCSEPFSQVSAPPCSASQWPGDGRPGAIETVARATQILVDHRANLIAAKTPASMGRGHPRRV